MKTLPKIYFVARDDGGCGYYRCQQPAEFIRRMGLAETEVFLVNPDMEKLAQADLVIMQEMGGETASKIVQFLLERKIPYLAEFDDFVHHVSPRNLGGYGAWNPSTLYVYRAMEMARAAFGLTVSTNQLAREYFAYNPTIFVIPNFLNKDLWDNPIVKRQDDKIRIGWAGGNAHADDLKMITPVIERITKEFKGKVLFETMGMTKQELSGVFPMEIIDQNCQKCGFEGTLHHHPGEGIKDYPMMLAGHGWDIAVAPVINNSFGNSKSDIKIKEYSAIGMPIVASDVVPYREAARSGATVLLAETYDEWYNAIVKLIKSKKLRGEIVTKNKDWMASRYIQDTAKDIFEVYRQVIEKAELIFGPKENRNKK